MSPGPPLCRASSGIYFPPDTHVNREAMLKRMKFVRRLAQVRALADERRAIRGRQATRESREGIGGILGPAVLKGRDLRENFLVARYSLMSKGLGSGARVPFPSRAAAGCSR